MSLEKPWTRPPPSIRPLVAIDDMPELDWTVDNPGLLLMSKLSLALLEGLATRSAP